MRKRTGDRPHALSAIEEGGECDREPAGTLLWKALALERGS